DQRLHRLGSAARILRWDCKAGAIGNARDELFQVHDHCIGLHDEAPSLSAGSSWPADAACTSRGRCGEIRRVPRIGGLICRARHAACADKHQPARGATLITELMPAGRVSSLIENVTSTIPEETMPCLVSSFTSSSTSPSRSARAGGAILLSE